MDQYNKYKESEEEFSYVLRMEYEWYDDKYQEMITLIRSIFEEYRERDVLPKSVIYFFTREIDLIIGIVSKDIFFNTIPDQYTREEFIHLIEKRKAELSDLKQKFFTGDFYSI